MNQNFKHKFSIHVELWVPGHSQGKTPTDTDLHLLNVPKAIKLRSELYAILYYT